MKLKKDVVLDILAAGFLIGISVKYLLECYTGIYAFQTFTMGGSSYLAYYADWYYPLLDFAPVFLIGVVLLFKIVADHLEVAVRDV
ncbi:MAG TPA: hypothetical protein VMW40_08720 [Candidatus Bathyarchaeia archaeon]|nr:hypothetical protein [Candidatus Bathyarchaeia archaeon]